MWGQLVGAGLGAIGGAKGGGKSGGTPKFVKRQIKQGYGNLNAATSRSAAEAIAPQNADQLAGMDMVRAGAGTGMGNIGFASDMARRAAGGVTQADIQGFYNPYEDQVIGNAMNDLSRQRGINMMQINSQAEAAKAFGGDRAEVAKSLASDEWTRRMAEMVGGLRFGGYNSAMDAAFRNNGAMLAGAGGLLDAANQERQAVYGDAMMRQGVGDTQYAYDQGLLDHPLKMAQLQVDAGVAGLGAQRPTSSGGGGISGAMGGALGGFDTFGKLFPSGGGGGSFRMANDGGFDWSLVGL